MKQNEMREALHKAETEMRYAGWANYVHDNFGRQEAYRAVQQALAVPERELVRLTDSEIFACFDKQNTGDDAQRNVLFFAHAVQTAMIAKNGGKV